MNFTEFSFWWLLFLLGIPFFCLRFIGKRLKIWSSLGDRLGLMIISLALFWNAAQSSFLIFGFELLFNYFMVRWMQRQPESKAKIIAAAIILVDLGILFYFKYLDFFVEDIFGLAVGGISTGWNTSRAIPGLRGIPPGISFYSFQMVAFVVDSLKTKSAPPIKFIDYINFASFFPQVVAGPIERRGDLFPQIQSFQFKFNVDNIDTGLKWLVLGMFMKLVLGDNLADFVNLQETANPWTVWMAIYLFGLRIYFDFAGYSFIALGIARMIGVNLTVNFNAPYISQNIQEFWRRWHVTLSTWFRDYLFIPLGGSRVGRTGLNILIVFTVSGLWHGAGWNFIFWGAYHGGLLIIHRYFGSKISLPPFLAWALTFFSAMVGWLFFMETNINQLGLKIQTLLNPFAYSFSNLQATISGIDDRSRLSLMVLLSLAVLLSEHLAAWKDRSQVYRFFLIPHTALTLLGLLILLAAKSSSQFVYFAF